MSTQVKIVGPVAPVKGDLHALMVGMIMGHVGERFEVTMLDDENGAHQAAFDVVGLGGNFRVTVEPLDE